MRQRLSDVLWRRPACPLECWLALVTCALGTWLILPFDTFGGARIYQTMARLAPEWVWGMGMVVVAGWHLARFSRLVRRGGSLLLLVGWWTGYLVLSVLGNPATAAVPVYGAIVLGLIWCWLRLPAGEA